MWSIHIRMQDPLKQGLKHIGIAGTDKDLLIRMQDPLKQGLKLSSLTLSSSCGLYSNARSIKTRIETTDIYNPKCKF